MTHRHISIPAARTLLRYMAVAGLALSNLQAAFADADITFHGTLKEAPPCVVNGNELIVVDFGSEVMTTRIDGTTYSRPVRFTVDCTAAISNLQRVRISGTPASFGNSVLAGDRTGFGFAFSSGDSPVKLDEWLNFTAPQVPSISVTPVKQDGVTLTGGAFRTLASLVVDYQ